MQCCRVLWPCIQLLTQSIPDPSCLCPGSNGQRPDDQPSKTNRRREDGERGEIHPRSAAGRSDDIHLPLARKSERDRATVVVGLSLVIGPLPVVLNPDPRPP